MDWQLRALIQLPNFLTIMNSKYNSASTISYKKSLDNNNRIDLKCLSLRKHSLLVLQIIYGNHNTITIWTHTMSSKSIHLTAATITCIFSINLGNIVHCVNALSNKPNLFKINPIQDRYLIHIRDSITFSKFVSKKDQLLISTNKP